MSKSLYKIPYLHKSFFKGFEVKDKDKESNIKNKKFSSKERKSISFKKKFFNKSSCISCNWIDKKIGIYNGNTYITLNVNYKQLGFKIGQFCITRKLPPHSGKQKQIKKVSRAIERLVASRKSLVNRRSRRV